MKATFISASLVLALSLVSCQSPEETAQGAPPPAETPATKPYPLDVCLVSGEELGSMGDPVVIIHEGQEIKFCCDKCVPKFEADPAKYLSKLEKP